MIYDFQSFVNRKKAKGKSVGDEILIIIEKMVNETNA